ncbi:MAG: aminodeoxychorismate lyase [Pseudomonadota bacterium]|nr:aminodeoxychorismate lyase [Candidatus Acidoferrales bacterium]
MLSLVDGQSASCVPLDDRGLQYGEGLFETVLVDAGEPLAWNLHMARLAQGCRALGLPDPPLAALHQDALQLCGALDGPAVLKLTLTVQGAGRGYARPPSVTWRRIVHITPAPDWPAADYQRGIRVRWCRQLWFPEPRLAGIKHLNRLTQVLARAEWDDSDIAEGLLRDPSGAVIGGTMSNLFLVRDGVLFTPVIRNCGIKGTLRARILACAGELGIPVRESVLAVADCHRADELLLCNAVRGIRPIRMLGRQSFDVGRVTQALQRAIAGPWPRPTGAVA